MLYGRDRNTRWHRYELIEPSLHITALLDEIGSDPTGTSAADTSRAKTQHGSLSATLDRANRAVLDARFADGPMCFEALARSASMTASPGKSGRLGVSNSTERAIQTTAAHVRAPSNACTATRRSTRS
jgi:Protein of unknown function (DUF3024)